MSAPPAGLLAFYWHFVRQMKGWYAAMFAASLAVAALDTVIPLFIGKLVSLMEALTVWRRCGRGPMLAGMVALVLVVRPLVLLADIAIRHGADSRRHVAIRWQSHWHVIRQSWPFFQNDFAGRIANRVMQTAHALRESVMASIRAVWYIGAYGVMACALMAMADWRLGVPTLLWFASYLASSGTVPRMRDLARESSEARSLVMARVVDSYTNILTVKLFARLADEDAYVRESIDEHRAAMSRHMKLITRFHFCLTVMNAALLVATAAIGIWLGAGRGRRRDSRGITSPSWQLANVGGLGELGGDRDLRERRRGAGRHAVDRGAALGVDRPGAQPLEVSRGEIRFEDVTFAYGRSDAGPVLDKFLLQIQPGERVGLGRSGRENRPSSTCCCGSSSRRRAASSSTSRTSRMPRRRACAPRSAW